jgi:hypothetical protein
MNIEKPTPSVPETFKPPTGRDYRVTSKDSWVSLAGALKIGPWDLIDFNFPGMKSAMQINAELASRQVNWYLSEYLGYRVSRDGRNLAFSEGPSAGRGVHKGGSSSFRPLRRLHLHPRILPRRPDVLGLRSQPRTSLQD